MVTAVVSLAAAMVSGLVTFGLTRRYQDRDREDARLRAVEKAAAEVTRCHDRLGVIETAIQVTGQRVNAVDHNLEVLVSELRVQGVRVSGLWQKW